jgi:hypothetical protein
MHVQWYEFTSVNILDLTCRYVRCLLVILKELQISQLFTKLCSQINVHFFNSHEVLTNSIAKRVLDYVERD